MKHTLPIAFGNGCRVQLVDLDKGQAHKTIHVKTEAQWLTRSTCAVNLRVQLVTWLNLSSNMANNSIYSLPGFDFSNQLRWLHSSLSIHHIYSHLGGRNTFMLEKGLPIPKATSTGTTIVGCLFKDGIILGADTRATEGPIVADKNCEKVLIHCSFPFFFVCLTLFHKDSLYHRIYQMLWCGNGRWYRIYHCLNFVKHGTTWLAEWSEASRRHSNDDVEATAFQVNITISWIYESYRCKLSDIRVMSELPLCSVVLMLQAPTCLLFIPMDRPTSFRMLRWDLAA